MDKIKLDAIRYGVSNEFMQALHAFVEGFNKAQQTRPTEQQIDELADKVIATMPDGIRGCCRTWGWQQFARALLSEFCGTSVKSSIDSAKDQEITNLKRQLAAAQNDVKQLRASRDKRNSKSASIADLSINVSVDSQKSSQMLGFLDEFAKSAKAMEQAASEAVNALNRMAQSAELIKVEPPSVGSKSYPPGNDGVAHYPKGVWIEWNGGECPVKPNDVVLVMLKNGATSKGKAGYLRWDKRSLDGDITAFMIL